MRQLIKVCESRANMLPILADARNAESYSDIVEACDIIYQDVSARDQAEILLKNSRFLKSKGYAYFVIKSQSISIVKKPEEVFKDELGKLKGTFEMRRL